MAYLHAGAIYYTPAAINVFTNNCNAGKLNKDTYDDESNMIIIDKIKLRRKAYIAAAEVCMAHITEHTDNPISSTKPFIYQQQGNYNPLESVKIPRLKRSKLSNLQRLPHNAELDCNVPEFLPKDGCITDNAVVECDNCLKCCDGCPAPVIQNSPHSASGSSGTVSTFIDFEAISRFWTNLNPMAVTVYEQKIEAFFALSDVVTVNDRIEEIEASWMKADMDDFYESNVSDTAVIGYCYAIWNNLFADLIKIGMTRRTPEIRVRELSGAGLPEPFEIVAILPCTNPVKMERAIHAHYASIRKYGKKKEFFTLSRAEVAMHFGSLIANAMQDPPARRLPKKRTLKAMQAEIDALQVENANLKALYAHMP